MSRKSVFDLRGTNGWIIALAVAANLLWSFLTFIIAFFIVDVSGEMKQTDYKMTNGFWIGQTETRDRSRIYVTSVNGQLYVFDTATETLVADRHLYQRRPAR